MPKVIKLLLYLNAAERKYIIKEIQKRKLKGVEITYLKRLLRLINTYTSDPTKLIKQEKDLIKKYSPSTRRWIRSTSFQIILDILNDFPLDGKLDKELRKVNLWIQFGVRNNIRPLLPPINDSTSWNNHAYWVYIEPDKRLRRAYYDIFYKGIFDKETLDSVIVDTIIYTWNLWLSRNRITHNLIEDSISTDLITIIENYKELLEYLLLRMQHDNWFSSLFIYFILDMLKALNRIGMFWVLDILLPILYEFLFIYNKLKDNNAVNRGLEYGIADLSVTLLSLSFIRSFNIKSITYDTHVKKLITTTIDVFNGKQYLSVWYNLFLLHGFRVSLWHNDIELAYKLKTLIEKEFNNSFISKKALLGFKISELWYNLITNKNISKEDIECIDNIFPNNRYLDIELIILITKMMLAFEYPEWGTHPFYFANKIFNLAYRNNAFTDFATLIRRIGYTYENQKTRFNKFKYQLKDLYMQKPHYLRFEQLVPLYSWLDVKAQQMNIKYVFVNNATPIFNHNDLNYSINLITKDLIFKLKAKLEESKKLILTSIK